ncbi:MAG: hypothetical protein GXY68_03075 [Chloroflexi bacterium]|nr:hypothetical protein [Chloroflexota bacterium]
MNERLARLALADIPTTQLKQIIVEFDGLSQRALTDSGVFCGLDCPGTSGTFCGLDCHGVSRAAIGVIDRTNAAGITRAELDAARSQALDFKKTLLAEAHALGKVL